MYNLSKLDLLWEKAKELEKEIKEAIELPAVSSSDNGDVLTVVNGAWAKAANTSQLPAVTGADDDKVLTVVNGGWAAALPTGSGLHYSTNEIETFDTWIDGRPIYQKTFTGVIARGEYEYYYKMDLGAIAADAIIAMDGGLYDSNGNIIPLFSTLTADNTGYGDYSWEPRITGGHVEIGLNGSTSAVGYNYILTIKYVKPAANETKATKRKATK